MDYSAWYELFGNKALVDALLDRLRHHCISIRIDGPSLREPVPCDAEPAPAAASNAPERVKRPRRNTA